MKAVATRPWLTMGTALIQPRPLVIVHSVRRSLHGTVGYFSASGVPGDCSGMLRQIDAVAALWTGRSMVSSEVVGLLTVFVETVLTTLGVHGLLSATGSEYPQGLCGEPTVMVQKIVIDTSQSPTCSARHASHLTLLSTLFARLSTFPQSSCY